MSGQLQRIFDQMGNTMPLEIGHDRRASGYRSTINATPIPVLNTITTPIPPPTAGYSLEDVLTKSAIPRFTPDPSQYQPLITSMPVVPGSQAPEQIVPASTEEPEREIAEEPEEIQEAEVEPEETPEPEPKSSKCTGPQNLCPEELNQIIYRLLTAEVQPQINCAGDRSDLYQSDDPSEADFTYKAEYEFIYRKEKGDGNMTGEFVASPMVKLKYSRWGPVSSQNGKPPVRLLLIHDALDCRKGWWCCQKLLAPFVDTVSIDLMGSGDSTKPRGINLPTYEGSANGQAESEATTEVVPWSYEFHAVYLIEMIRVMWPTEKVYLAGVGWGAQIAITMAALSDLIAGVIMINPPGLSKMIHPEPAYLGIYHLARVPSDDLLDSSHVSITHLIREALLRNIRHPEQLSALNLVLDQYCSLDRKRVLIDQIVSISNFRYQELPRTAENPYGLQIENIKSPVLVFRGEDSSIYPETNSDLYPVVYYNAMVRTAKLRGTGHFAHLDDPAKLSSLILDFIRENAGIDGLKDIFIGFGTSTLPGEKKLINGFRDLYNV